MIRVYADGVLAYDSRLEDYDLQGLTITSGLNTGGTASIVMPPNHPAYGSFTSYKTIVEIYRDERLLFRGRALYPTEDNDNNRTVVCEGELCFFMDGVSRPYLYQADPATVFSTVLELYNAQATPERQFKLGTVTVTDPNDYIRVESQTAESVLDTLNKLRERCGGYFVFTTDPDGFRAVNWYAELDYRSDQVIEFGENLLSFARNGSNLDLITAVLPYGAQDAETGERVTIESVNDGLDYIQDDDAVALRGFIIRPVNWDDVTEPLNLLRKAQQYLEEHRYIITALELSALDLSYVDKRFDTFQLGDLIRVRSKPHKVDDDFLLTSLTEDLLNPAASTITLGKDVSTLTGADVAGDDASLSAIQKVTHTIKADYTLNIAQAIAAAERQLSSLIEQESQRILLQVADTYVTNDKVTEAVSTSVELLRDSLTVTFNELKTVVDTNDAEMREHIVEQQSYIRMADGSIILGKSAEGSMTLTLENDLIVFKKNGQQFGWWDGVDFHTGNIVVEVNERAQFGDFAWIPREGGNLSLLKVK